jgi:hypothetical protein
MCGDTNPKVNAEEVEAFLKQRLGVRITGLRVLLREAVVVLQGTISSYYVKQLAQHAAMKVLCLSILANEIEVRWGLRTPDPDGPGLA